MLMNLEYIKSVLLDSQISLLSSNSILSLSRLTSYFAQQHLGSQQADGRGISLFVFQI